MKNFIFRLASNGKKNVQVPTDIDIIKRGIRLISSTTGQHEIGEKLYKIRIRLPLKKNLLLHNILFRKWG